MIQLLNKKEEKKYRCNKESTFAWRTTNVNGLEKKSPLDSKKKSENLRNP